MLGLALFFYILIILQGVPGTALFCIADSRSLKPCE